MFAHPKETSNIPIQRIYGKTRLKKNQPNTLKVKYNEIYTPRICEMKHPMQFPHLLFLKGHFIAVGDCPLHLPTRTAPPPPRNPVAPSPRSSTAPRATSPRTCPQKGTLLHRTWSHKTGRENGTFQQGGGERFFAKKKRSWGCGRVFEKKKFLFVSIQMVFWF